jgi:2-oxoglutarate ferredoxin oxidoreductase subunit gamma
MLGLIPLMQTESIIKVLEKKIPAGFVDMNRQALDLGLSLVEAAGMKEQTLF